MKNITTVAVYGDDFIGREKEIKEATYFLEQGNSIALFGLRRIGKSSMLKQLKSIFDDKKYSTIEIDCQILETKESFLMEVFKKLPNKNKFFELLKNIPKPIIDKFKINLENLEVDISFKKQITDYLDDISNALEKAMNDDKKIILFLDELPYFFENMKENGCDTNDIKKILTILRHWRNSGVCMLICGSIQIDYFLDNLEISRKLLSGLKTINIGVFDKDESFKLLDELAKSNDIKIPDDKKEEFLKLISDSTPFFIQNYFAQYILEKPQNEKEMEALYINKVFPDIEKEFLNQFDERFSVFDKKEKAFVEKIFNMISASSSINIRDIKIKINDFQEKTFLKLLTQEFIIKQNNEISFSFNIVKNWWEKKG